MYFQVAPISLEDGVVELTFFILIEFQDSIVDPGGVRSVGSLGLPLRQCRPRPRALLESMTCGGDGG
jgi:hypothetical protein